MSDHETQVAALIDSQLPEIQETIQELRRIIHEAAPELREEIKHAWGNLVYKRNSEVCAISPYSNVVHVNFYKGVRLSDPSRALEGNGREMRHMKVRSVDTIREDLLAQFVREAFSLDSNA